MWEIEIIGEVSKFFREFQKLSSLHTAEQYTSPTHGTATWQLATTSECEFAHLFCGTVPGNKIRRDRFSDPCGPAPCPKPEPQRRDDDPTSSAKDFEQTDSLFVVVVIVLVRSLIYRRVSSQFVVTLRILCSFQ